MLGLIRTKREIANQASGFKFIKNEKDVKEGVKEEEGSDEEEIEETEKVNEDDEREEEEDEEEDEEWYDEDDDNEYNNDDVDEISEDVAALGLGDEEVKLNAGGSDAPPASTTAGGNTTEAGPKLSEAPVRKGTEVKLVNMELGEHVALLRLVALALVVQCAKCKKKIDVALGPGKTVTKTCDKCRTVATVRTRES